MYYKKCLHTYILYFFYFIKKKKRRQKVRGTILICLTRTQNKEGGISKRMHELQCWPLGGQEKKDQRNCETKI